MKNKAGTGIFFILSCFAAMFVLLEFHGNYVFVGLAALLLLISSFCFLNALFAQKSKEWSALEEYEENGKESSGRTQQEFKAKVVNYMEAMNRSQNQMLQEVKSQNEGLKAEIKNLKNEITALSDKQVFQTKTVIKYNKENARQVALSEKKALEQAVQELKGVMAAQVGVSTVVQAAASKEVIVPEVEVPQMEEIVVPEVEVPQMEEVVVPEVEVPQMEEIVIPEVEVPQMEEVVMPEVEEIKLPSTDDFIVSDLPPIEDVAVSEGIPELPPMEDLPVLDDIVLQEEQPKPEPPVLNSDPNAMMTPDDIAKLLASMGM